MSTNSKQLVPLSLDYDLVAQVFVLTKTVNALIEQLDEIKSSQLTHVSPVSGEAPGTSKQPLDQHVSDRLDEIIKKQVYHYNRGLAGCLLEVQARSEILDWAEELVGEDEDASWQKIYGDGKTTKIDDPILEARNQLRQELRAKIREARDE